ncbi:MAG: hypothetical protein BGN86_13775 [Caulobacterales bacterium 68-7]|nr:MAG: hypothetical protein BGN86_13775 [Caulobacterales bacterium 68-7]
MIDKKKIARASAVQSALATVFALYMRFVFATLRWTREGEAAAEEVWAGEGGAILCLWHARIPLSPNAWPNDGVKKQPMRALISLSADGEFIAQAMEKLGFPAIRGSSKKASDPGKNKGGEVAFREMIVWVKNGGAVAITPDGPRGPANVMQPGTVGVARMTGVPALMCGIASKPCIRLGTWDQTVIPLPFGRAAMVWDGPLRANRDDDPEALVADWTARLSAVTARAEALVGN